MALDDLQNRWEARDHRYAMSRRPIDPESVIGVRWWRIGEARALPEPVQAIALREASHWEPPEHR